MPRVLCHSILVERAWATWSSGALSSELIKMASHHPNRPTYFLIDNIIFVMASAKNKPRSASKETLQNQ